MNIDPRFQTYLAKANDINAGEALDILIDIYINACGVSLGERTTAFYASFYWIARFKATHPELPKDMGFKSVMELRSEEYRQNKADIDKYDICGPDPEEILRISTLMIEDYEDDKTMKMTFRERQYAAERCFSYLFYRKVCQNKQRPPLNLLLCLCLEKDLKGLASYFN